MEIVSQIKGLVKFKGNVYLYLLQLSQGINTESGKTIESFWFGDEGRKHTFKISL